jgi:mono/diheme cytochrome c family protein
MMKRPTIFIGLVATVMVAAGSAAWPTGHAVAQTATGAVAAPFDLADPGHISEGERLFRQTCQGYCHGKGGGPARAPKLRGNKLDGNFIYGRIMGGSPNGMPAFASRLPQEQVWDLVAYVMSLSKVEDK